MNTVFAQTVREADGRYLTDQELQVLEKYAHSYSTRDRAYQILSEKANTLVVDSLKKLAATHRDEVVNHSGKCRRDMTYALKYIARSVLTDEPEVFRQDFSLWMENITRAVHKGDSATRAYQHLKVEIQAALPKECAALVVPYLDDLITAFSGV